MIDYNIIKKPVVTEKTTNQKDSLNQYTFEVDSRKNRIELKQNLEKIFNISILKIRTMNVKGKKVRRGRIIGTKKNRKKAIVTLQKGDRIEFFDGV